MNTVLHVQAFTLDGLTIRTRDGHEFTLCPGDSIDFGCCGIVKWKRIKKRTKRRKIKEAATEARAALYGCREVLGSVANIDYAINLLDGVICEG